MGNTVMLSLVMVAIYVRLQTTSLTSRITVILLEIIFKSKIFQDCFKDKWNGSNVKLAKKSV